MADNTYVVKVEVDSGGAIQNLDQIDNTIKNSNSTLIQMRNELKELQSALLELEPGTDEFNRLAQKAGEVRDRMKDVSEQINANAAPAFASISNQSTILRGKLLELDLAGAGESFRSLGAAIGRISFKDIQAGLTGMVQGLASLGKALLANPIFLLAGVIAAVVVNFDKLKKTLDFGVNPATRDFIKATQEASEASAEALKAFDLEERRLRALGVAEEEIAARRRELTVQRLKDIKAEIDAQTALLNEQQENVNKTNEALAQANINVFKGIEAGFRSLFGATQEDVKATAESVNQLQATSQELEVIILEIDKKIVDSEKSKNEQLKAERDRAAAEREKDLLEEDRRILQERERLRGEFDNKLKEDEEKIKTRKLENANEELKIIEDSLLQQLAAQTRAAQASAEIERQKEAIKLDLANQTVTAIISLNDAFAGQNEKSAKRAFEVNKALSIVQAIIKTYEGANAIFAAAAANPGTVLFPAQPFIAAGIAIATGLANVAKIAKTKFTDTSAGGGGGGGSFSSPGIGSSGAPQPRFNPIDTSFLQNRPPQQPAVRTYVLQGDVASAQEADEKINALTVL